MKSLPFFNNINCILHLHVHVRMLMTWCLFVVKQTDRGTEFRRSHHMVRKTTLYDMGVDPTCKYAAVGCQDRCIRYVFSLFKKCSLYDFILLFLWVCEVNMFSSARRIFNINSGKQKKLYKGSLGEDGSLIRVTFLATAILLPYICTECLLFPHSFVLTGTAWSVRSIRGHQLLWQKHQHLWIQHRGMCGHDVWTLW